MGQRYRYGLTAAQKTQNHRRSKDMNSTTPSEGLTLVLGGTGKIGRRVVERLSVKGHAVRNGSRQSDPPFDWAIRATGTPCSMA